MNTNEILPVKEEIPQLEGLKPQAELNVNDILPLPVKVEEIPLEILKPQAELIDINKIVKDRQKELISHAKPSEIIMEYVGRICYDSWEKRTADSVQPFLITAAKKGHRTIFEFNQLFFSVKLPMAARKPILKTQHYKYLNVCNVYDNGVIAMTGSLRAFIELLESYLIDEDQSPILFKSLYMAINQKYDYLFDNWPTAIGLKQLNNLINEIPDYKNMVIFDDVTSDYKNPNKNTKILSHITCGREMSLQIVRHRPVSYQQSCLAPDTIIPSFSKRKWTIEKLYNYSQNIKTVGRLKLIRLRGLSDDDILIPVKIKKIFKTGINKVYEVITQSGRKIKTTMNHQFKTPDGWKILQELKVNDMVLANGVAALKSYDFLYEKYVTEKRTAPEIANLLNTTTNIVKRNIFLLNIKKGTKSNNLNNLINNYDFIYQKYIIENMERKDVAKLLNVADSTLGKYIRKFKLQKPKSNYPNRVGSKSIGRQHSIETKNKLSVLKQGELNPNWKDCDITENSSRSRARNKFINTEKICECGKQGEIHHIDGNPFNNDDSNLESLCSSCHKARHYMGTMTVFKDKIISINYIGECQTYDIEIDHPCHNFIANGIVVHNSQRYVRFNKENPYSICVGDHLITNKRLDFKKFVSEMHKAFIYYTELLKNLKPEDARVALPNCTTTRLFMYATKDEYRHIFSLRQAKDAYHPIRQIFNQLYNQLINDRII